jgi:hypothetical protein
VPPVVPDPFTPTSTAVAGGTGNALAPPPPPPPPLSSTTGPPGERDRPTEATPKVAATAAMAGAAVGATQVFDAGPVLADMVTGKSAADNGHGSRRRTMAVVAAAAVAVIGSGVAAYALVSHNNKNDSKHAAAPTTFLPTTAPTVAPTTIANTTSSAPPTTAVPATQPTTATTATTAPAPPATQATTPPPPPTPAPTVSVSGPSSVEDNVGVVFHASTTNATSGNWSLTGGPPVNLHNTAWRPGYAFGFSAGCNAVGATYTLTLHATGPGGSNSGSTSFTVHDTNGSCH